VRELCTTQDGKGGLKSPKLLAPSSRNSSFRRRPRRPWSRPAAPVFDPATGERLALYDPKTRAHAIFIDPRMLQSAPRALVASASVNTFATAIEGLMSRSGDPLADALLMHSVRLLAQRLPRPRSTTIPTCAANSCSPPCCAARERTTRRRDHDGARHAIGARYELENGTINAIVLPHVLRFNADAATAGLAKVAASLGSPRNDAESPLPMTVHTVKTIFAALGVQAGCAKSACRAKRAGDRR